nr:MAG TPA: hypothetical protein [Caudoviricetes sp.]
MCVFGCTLERAGVIWLSFSLYNSALLTVFGGRAVYFMF